MKVAPLFAASALLTLAAVFISTSADAVTTIVHGAACQPNSVNGQNFGGGELGSGNTGSSLAQIVCPLVRLHPSLGLTGTAYIRVMHGSNGNTLNCQMQTMDSLSQNYDIEYVSTTTVGRQTLAINGSNLTNYTYGGISASCQLYQLDYIWSVRYTEAD